MITITAVIRAKAGKETALRDALLKVAAHVQVHEPETLGFHVSQGLNDASVFTTYERFLNETAMHTHNASEAVARFFAKGEALIDGDVILHACRELSTDG